jgi:membrane-bound serine protease (ClpP class)
MSRSWVLGCVLAIAASYTGARSLADDRPLILKLSVNDEAITPVTARFIRRALEQAEDERAECLVVVLDTPGGLADSARAVVKDILASTTPVVVYVSPSGARAASAGVFITLAGHVAAMAPGTHIGAAHPVQIGGLPISPAEPARPAPEGGQPGTAESQPTSPSATMEAKIVNDTVAWARALAELRGRNADWAERAVRESVSITGTEAVEQGVVDLLAEDLDDLLAQLDGREVVLPQGPVQLHTSGATVRTLDMWWGERLLGAISNPNIAFLLLMLGFYGILFELYTPGWGVSGTLGVVCLILAFFGLAVLPISYVGLALIAVALGFFVAEAFVTSYGLLAVAGVGCMVLGGVMLVDSPFGFMRVSLGVVVPIAAATGLITVFLVANVLRTHRRPVRTGGEGLVGAEAVAKEDFSRAEGRYVGTVLTHGELWQAVSSAPVSNGQLLEVLDRHGLTLIVRVPYRGRDLSMPETPT